MPKLRIAVLSLFVFITGCGTPGPEPYRPNSTVQPYRPANYDGPPMMIAGNYNEFSGRTKIYINKEVALYGRLSFSNGRTELNGQYGEYNISASCRRDYEQTYTSIGLLPVEKVECMVFVNNERAAILSF